MSKIATKTITETGLTFEFADGHKAKIEFDDLSDDMKHRCMVHGLSQKLGDSYAGGLTLTEAKERFQATLEGLLADQWNSGRQNAGGGDLLIALMEATGQPEDTSRETILALGEDKKKALRKHDAIKPILARLAAERLKATADKLGEKKADVADLVGLFG